VLVQNMSSLEGSWMTDLQQVISAKDALQFLERYGGSHAIEDFFKTYTLGVFVRSEEIDPDMAVVLAEIFKNARERKSIFEQIQRENQKLLETLLKDKNIFVLDAALDEHGIQEFASKIDQKTSYVLIAEHGDTHLPDDFRQTMEGLFKNTKRLRFIQISGEITQKAFIAEMQNALTELTGASFESQKDVIISLYQNTHEPLYQALAGELAVDVLSANGHIPPVVEDRLKSLGILPDDQSESLRLLEEVQMVQERRKQVHAIYQRTLRAK
jgi:23S rRNA pseudoU1915 N3-methylase RlmH